MNNQSDQALRTYEIVAAKAKGTGPGSAGQSGDTQGLPDVAEAGPLSVEELLQDGQAFEACVIGGVEDAPDADEAEVHTKKVPQDDMRLENLEKE